MSSKKDVEKNQTRSNFPLSVQHFNSMKDIFNRLSTYYPFSDLMQLANYSYYIDQARKYFRAFELLSIGEPVKSIAEQIWLHKSTIYRWINDQKRPSLIDLACRIPRRNPGSEQKWLPIIIKQGPGFQPQKFISVPYQIRNWALCLQTIRSLTSLQNTRVSKWYRSFGYISREHAFAYVLGILVSDASKPTNSRLSTGLDLSLTKKYSWSNRIGEAVCYYLSKLGIAAKRIKFKLAQDGYEKYRWISERTPLITWMMRSVLGLKQGETTTHNPVRMEWLLSSPYDIRLMFLQALNDGDGFANPRNQVMGNSCGPNAHFISALIQTFKIESRIPKNEMYIEIKKSNNIVRAVKLPYFLHAKGRQADAEKLLEMIQARQMQNGDVPDNVLKRMIELRNQGHSYGSIAEMVFDQFGLSFTLGKVYYGITKEA